MTESEPERRFRTLFISDVHLGTRGCQADRLLDFLQYHDADTIYLVGDIVDGWALKANWYWPQAHNDVVQKLLRKARKGSRIIYVPGNHDEFLRNYYGTHFGGIEVVEQTDARGRRRPALPGHPRRHLRPRGAERALARPSRRPRLRLRDPDQPLRQHVPPHVRPAVLVAVAVGEAEGEERGQLHRRVRTHARRRGAALRRRRRDLRPHPLRDHARRARHPLHQLRRLGRELHRGRRARRRALRDHQLGQRVAARRRCLRLSRCVPPDEGPRRHRCLASAGQRGRADADDDVAGDQGARRRDGIPHAGVASAPCHARLSRTSASRCRARPGSRG